MGDNRIIFDGGLKGMFEQALAHLHQKYHTYPTQIPDVEVSSEESLEMYYYSALASSSGNERHVSDDPYMSVNYY